MDICRESIEMILVFTRGFAPKYYREHISLNVLDDANTDPMPVDLFRTSYETWVHDMQPSSQ